MAPAVGLDVDMDINAGHRVGIHGRKLPTKGTATQRGSRRAAAAKTAATAVAAGTLTALAPGLASASTRPAWLTAGQHSCSYTSPEYMLSDWDMLVHANPGTTQFTATHTNLRPGRYEDAYWVTGYHDESSAICDGRTVVGTGGLKAKSLTPGLLNGPAVTTNFSASGSNSARLGFELWLTASTAEHTPTAMEADPSTWEILVQPGKGMSRDNPGWHRVEIGAGTGRAGALTVWGLNLTALAERAGVPHGYHWAAIDAGGETPGGSFTVNSYYLHIAGQQPALAKAKAAPQPAPRPRPAVVRRWMPSVTGERLTAAEATIRRAGFTHLHAPRPVPGHVVIITRQSRRAYANVKTFAVYLWGREK